MKKILCLFLAVSILLSVFLVTPNISATTGTNGKKILSPGTVDDGSTFDFNNSMNGSAFYPSQKGSDGNPLVFVPESDTFNVCNGQVDISNNEYKVQGFFTDKVTLRAPNTQSGVSERYVDYNVEGGSYIGFLSYYRNNFTANTISKMWFNTHNNGVRVMYSTDNGATWNGPLSYSALFEFVRLTNPTSVENGAQNPQSQLDNLPAQVAHMINNNSGQSNMLWFYEYVGMCHSYSIPSDATMVRYIFPADSVIQSEGEWLQNRGFLYGGAAASSTPINDKTFSFVSSEPKPDLPKEPEKPLFTPGSVDNLIVNDFGSTQYGAANFNNFGIPPLNNIDEFLKINDTIKYAADNKFSEDIYFLGYNILPSDLYSKEKSLTYRVVGDSYFAFDFFSSNAESLQLANLLYDRNGTGWQLWFSSDNGKNYKKAEPYEFYLNKMVRFNGSSSYIVKDSDCWFGQGVNKGLLDFLKLNMHSSTTIGLSDPNAGASHFILGKSYYLPEGTTNAKIVFPDLSYVSNGEERWKLALTGVKASLTPITAESAGSKATVDGVTLPEYDNTFALDTFNKATGAVAAATGSANVNYSYDDSNVYVNVETDADIVDFYYINNINFLQNITGNTVFDLFNIPANVDGDVSSAIGKISYNATTGKFTTDNMGGVFSADEAKDAKATETGVSFIVPRSTVCDKFLFHVAAYNEGDSTMLSTGSINGGSLAGFKTLSFADVSSKYTFADGKVNNIKYGTSVNSFIMGNGKTVSLFSADGKALASNTILGTGAYAVVDGNKYDIVLENDVNGDADFNILDAVTVRNSLLGIYELSDASKEAINTKTPSLIDLLSLKSDILNGKKFEEEKEYCPKYISLDGEFSIKGQASRESLQNYLASASTLEGFISATTVGDLVPGVDPTFEQDLQTVLTTGSRLIARAGFIWSNGLELITHFANSKKYAKYVHDIDSRIILEACIFEAIGEETSSRTIIPEYVLEAFGEPIEKSRPFDYWNIINYDYLNIWGNGTSVPDMTTLEGQMWCYYLATQYIDAGFDIIDFGQIALISANDDGTAVNKLFNMVREYAAENGRNNNVLITAHVYYNLRPEILYSNPSTKLLNFDYLTFPSRIYDGNGSYEIESDGYMPCTIEVGFIDSLYGRTPEGMSPQGYYMENALYLVEFDNFGHESMPDGVATGTYIPWGYDEITWYALQPKRAQMQFMTEAIAAIRSFDDGVGYFALPFRRNSTRIINGEVEYMFNASSKVKNGAGLEAFFRQIITTSWK